MKVVFAAFGRILVMLCPTAEHLPPAGHLNNETRSLCWGQVQEELIEDIVRQFGPFFSPSDFTLQSYNACFLIL